MLSLPTASAILATIASNYIYLVYQPEQLDWVFALAVIGAVLMAYGIGANDVANSFGTSVGSGAISIRSALVIAGIMEFVGAVTMGQAVTETIRSNIADVKCFENSYSEFMLGMMCSLYASGIWLLIASYFGLPVSTTHSTVGAVIGFALSSQGYQCVVWGWGKEGKGLLGIAMSWIISPVTSGILGSIIYLLVVMFVIKAPNPQQRGFQSISVVFAFTIAIVVALVFFKSPATKNVEEWIGAVVVCSSAVLAFIVGSVVGTRAIKKLIVLREKLINRKKKKQTYASLPENENKRKNNKVSDEEKQVTLDEDEYDMKQKMNDNERNTETESRALKEAEVDKIFVFFQVVTASFESFAHGANDTANAIGPFAAVYYLWVVGKPTTGEPPDWWIMAIGGAGIVIGLATFGRRVMDTIGKDITHVNFTRGFSIELSSTLCVVMASWLGFPISTTHCQVGSVFAVGLTSIALHKTRWAPIEPVQTIGVSWKIFLNVGISWLVTIPFSAAMSSGLFGLLVHTLIREDLGHCMLNDTTPVPPPSPEPFPSHWIL